MDTFRRAKLELLHTDAQPENIIFISTNIAS